MTDQGNSVTCRSFTPESSAALTSRAISVEDAAELGIYPVLTAQDLPRSLSHWWDGPGMLIQWEGLDTNVTPQYRPDTPKNTDENGRVQKYLFPKGCGTVFNWLRRPASETSPVLIVEGALKGPAAALYSPSGLAVVSIPGCRLGKNVDLSWAQGREVYVAFDADMATNPDVWDGAFFVRHGLMDCGATVVKFLSIGADGKDGIDDALGKLPESGRRDALREWLLSAGTEMPAKPVKVGGMILPSPKFPTDVAALLGGEFVDEQGNPTLINRDGVWLTWETTHWIELTETQVNTMLTNRTKTAFYVKYDKEGRPVIGEDGRPKMSPWNPVTSDIRELRMALQAELDGSREFGTDVVGNIWLKGKSDDKVMSFSNGLMNLRTRHVIPHTAAYFNLTSVPYDYVGTAPAPVEWLKFLNSIWGNDPDSIALLQEWFGYVLSGRTDLQKILLFLGPPGSGKGTIGRLLARLLGEKNYIGVMFSTIATNFGKQNLIGRSILNITDGRLQRDHMIPVMEFLLSVSGEDPVQLDRKNRTPWNGTLPTRIMITSNGIPAFPDESGALSRRYLTLDTVRGPEVVDREIESRCAAELSGILLWALEGLDRLNRNGDFSSPESSRTVTVLRERQAAPVSAFLADWCTTGDPEQSELKTDMYESYKAWCAVEGVEHPMVLARFASALYETGKGVTPARPRRNGKQVGVFTGVRLRATCKPGVGWLPPEDDADACVPPQQALPGGVAQPSSAVPAQVPLESVPTGDPWADGLDLTYEV